VEQARVYDLAGADELAFLDISATPQGHETVVDIVRSVADQVFMPLTVGGGIRTLQDMRKLLLAGADKVSINSAAVDHPELLTQGAEAFGSQCIILSVDAKWVEKENDKSFWEVYIHGGRTPTGRDALEWIEQGVAAGAGELLLTSIDTDGTMGGYNIELTRRVSDLVSVPLIASGGAGEMSHFTDVLTEGRADAALAASLFHDGDLSIPALKQYLRDAGVPIRTVQSKRGL
jgi:cyclase